MVSNYRSSVQYFENRAARGHWLQIRLEGVESNRDAIGAMVRVRTGDRWQLRHVASGDGYGSQSSKVLHFGLGAAGRVDELVVRWPSGRIERVLDVRGDQVLSLVEGASPAATRQAFRGPVEPLDAREEG